MNVKKLGYFIVLLIVLLVFSGCANNANKEDDAETGDKTKDTEGAGEKSAGGELNFAFNAQPPNLDPHTNTDTETRDISLHIYEPLLTLNTSLEVEPMLAETYEVSDGGETITFNLRQGIKFHNGKEMKADDVIASMERWQGLSSQAGTYLEGTEWEAEDDYTVIAHIVEPTTLDLYILSDMTQFAAIMPKELVENAGAEAVAEYVGTGPYKVGEVKQDQYVHLTKYDEFVSRTEPADGLAGEKKGIVDDVYFHIVTDASTRVAGLQSGEYDIAKSIPQDNAEMLANDPHVKNSVFTNSFPTIIFNKKAGAFSDQKAREAANASVDIEDLLIAGYGSDEFYEEDHALVKESQTSWYSDAGSDVYNLFDVELAKEMLEESSYAGEEVVVLATRDKTDEYNMMVVLHQQLEAIGMNARLEVTDLSTMLELREDENNWDVMITAFAFRPMPTQYLFLNPGWFGWTDSEELQELGDKILYADSIEDAQQFSDEYQKVFWEYLPVIKPGNKTDIISMGNHIEGLQYITGPIIWNVTVGE